MYVLLIAINSRINGPVTRRRHDQHASTSRATRFLSGWLLVRSVPQSGSNHSVIMRGVIIPGSYR